MAIGLAACAAPRESAPPQSPPQSRTESPPPAQSAVRTPAPAPRAAPTSAPRLTRADLIGRDAAALDAALGAPDLVRRDGAGEVRLYRGPACVLHVFVYARNGAAQATHIEARDTGGRLDADRMAACIAGFGTLPATG
jgi:hypothetical protein